MKRVLVAILFITSLLASAGNVVNAQDQTPEPGPNAAKLLPSGAKLGKGWKQAEVRGLEASADLFQEGAVASYTGPNGSRAVVYAWLVTSSRAAVRQSWESTSSLFDTYHYSLNYGYERDRQLESVPAPEGCTEAKRTDGEDKYLYAPAAITMCAADPDRIVLAVVVGGISGINDYTISDWLAGTAISGKDIAKPTAPAPDASGA